MGGSKNLTFLRCVLLSFEGKKKMMTETARCMTLVTDTRWSYLCACAHILYKYPLSTALSNCSDIAPDMNFANIFLNSQGPKWYEIPNEESVPSFVRSRNKLHRTIGADADNTLKSRALMEGIPISNLLMGETRASTARSRFRPRSEMSGLRSSAGRSGYGPSPLPTVAVLDSTLFRAVCIHNIAFFYAAGRDNRAEETDALSAARST